MNRREFLKLSGATLLGATLAGFGAQKLIELSMVPLQPIISNDSQNVIILVMDTVRVHNMSLYGYRKATTPHLDWIASQGILFNRAIAPASWTLPSHASLFTGHNSLDLGVGFSTPLDRTYPTIAECFRNTGYYTSGFVSNLWYCSSEWGLNRGFDHYEDYDISVEQALLSTSIINRSINQARIPIPFQEKYNLFRKDAEQLREDFIKWVGDKGKKRPFFAFLNFIDAHQPFVSPQRFTNQFVEGNPRPYYPKKRNQSLDKQILNELVGTYDSCIAFIDEQIGLLVNELERKGILENTIIFITSDHGEQFGEHGLFKHSNSAYMTLLNVPLIIFGPGRIPENKIVDTPVSLMDIPKTAIELSGLDSVIEFPGKSLSRFWGGESRLEMIRSESIIEINKDQKEVGIGPIKSLLFGDFHYINNPDNSEELYDIKNDPDEAFNLASSELGEKYLPKFRTAL